MRELDIYFLNNLLNSIFIRHKSIDSAIDYFFRHKNSTDIIKINDLLASLFHLSTEEQKLNFLTYSYYNFKNANTNQSWLLVGTLPLNIGIKIRKTLPVVEELITSAKKNLLITGYSISDYSKSIFTLIENQVKVGIKTYIFINDDDKLEEYFREFFNTLGGTLRIFRYKSTKTNLNSTMHAKIIISDKKKALISSSNLSYGGFINNIELGTLVEGDQITKLFDAFLIMLNEGFFYEIF